MVLLVEGNGVPLAEVASVSGVVVQQVELGVEAILLLVLEAWVALPLNQLVGGNASSAHTVGRLHAVGALRKGDAVLVAQVIAVFTGRALGLADVDEAALNVDRDALSHLSEHYEAFLTHRALI